MPNKILIKTPNQMSLVDDLLNHCWLDADEILFVKNQNLLKIALKIEIHKDAEIIKEKWFGLSKIINVPVFNAFLNIKNIDKYVIDDTQKIGLYDICEIEYNSEENKLSFITGVPFVLEVSIKSFEIELEVEDTPYKWIERPLIFNGLVESISADDI